MKNKNKSTVFLVCVILLFQFLNAQEIKLDYEIVLPNNSSQTRAIADFNNDGKGDFLIVEGEFKPIELAWYEAPNWIKHSINNKSLKTLHYVADSTIGDVDGDGDNDIIIPDAHEGAMRAIWYENPLIGGSSKKGEWNEHVIANFGDVSWLKDIEIADFNNDGTLDVAIRAERDFFILYQTGSDNWSKNHFSIKPHEGLTSGDVDRDGFIDVISNGFWLKNPGKNTKAQWMEYTFDAKWYNQNTDSWQDNNCQVNAGDINSDGLLDIVISQSEKKNYPVSWYSAPADPINGTWVEHVIDSLDYCHTIQLADFDNNGSLDILASEMVKGDDPDEMILYLNNKIERKPNSWKDKPVSFTKQKIQDFGSYWAIAGDLEGDGDIDVISSRSYDSPPIEIWKNTISNDKQSLDNWTYIEVDDDRQSWSDFSEPEWLQYVGLAAGDMSNDGNADIVSGRYCYINPAGNMTGKWNRIDFGKNVDAVLITDVDDDIYGDVIALALPNVYWLEAKNKEATEWSITQITRIPPPGHVNSQGYTLAQIIPGGKPEILLESGEGVYCIQIPATPEIGSWPTLKLTSTGTHAEGIGTGDIDGDGYIDIATGKGWVGVVWWKNPGDGSGNWSSFEVGKIDRDYVDKVVIADINGDKRNDIVVVEELYPDMRPARAYWFEQPKNPTEEPALFNWKRHNITDIKFTLNNLNVVDIDYDGDMDVITAEHKGDKSTFIYENNGNGKFTEHIISKGKEGHGGAYVFDLDNDGDFDIINIAWEDYKYLHLFRNDAIMKQD